MASGLSSATTSARKVEWLHRARSLNLEVTDELDAFSSAENDARLLPARFRDSARLAQYGHAGKAEPTPSVTPVSGGRSQDQTRCRLLRMKRLSPFRVPYRTFEFARARPRHIRVHSAGSERSARTARQRVREPSTGCCNSDRAEVNSVRTSIGNIESAILTPPRDPLGARSRLWSSRRCCPPLHKG